MPQATQHIEPGTGLLPAPRTAPDDAPGALSPAPPRAEGWFSALVRGAAVLRGLWSLRPVEARRQEPYGEVDGQ